MKKGSGKTIHGIGFAERDGTRTPPVARSPDPAKGWLRADYSYTYPLIPRRAVARRPGVAGDAHASHGAIPGGSSLWESVGMMLGVSRAGKLYSSPSS